MEFPDVLTAATIVLVAMLSSFLRGFQNKNIVAGYKAWTFGTGYLMGILDAVAFTLIASTGMVTGVFYGLGMGIGYVLSIIVHKRVSKAREKARKKKKRNKLTRTVEDLVEEMLVNKGLIEEIKK